jgi:hypothetical protein
LLCYEIGQKQGVAPKAFLRTALIQAKMETGGICDDGFGLIFINMNEVSPAPESYKVSVRGIFHDSY